jgi:anti-sigma factor RsiW
MVEREPAISEEQLHAYVDGQIAGGECAAIERWLESHSEDAARVAAWRAQADAMRARYGAVVDEPVPPRFDLAKLARGDRRWSRLAAAAALLAFVVGSSAGWFGRDVWEGAGPTRVVTTEAFEAHRLYIAEVRHPIEVKAGESHLNRWLSRRVGYEMPTPDLDAFGLKLLGGRLLPGNAGRPALLYMYEGATGERFTLYSRRDQAPQSALRYRAAGPVGSVFWVEEDAAYVVSGPADRARLQKVAESVYEQLENRPKQTGSLSRQLSDIRGTRK